MLQDVPRRSLTSLPPEDCYLDLMHFSQEHSELGLSYQNLTEPPNWFFDGTLPQRPDFLVTKLVTNATTLLSTLPTSEALSEVIANQFFSYAAKGGDQYAELVNATVGMYTQIRGNWSISEMLPEHFTGRYLRIGASRRSSHSTLRRRPDRLVQHHLFRK